MTGRRSLLVSSAVALSLVAGPALADSPAVTDHGNGIFSGRPVAAGVSPTAASLGDPQPRPGEIDQLNKLFPEMAGLFTINNNWKDRVQRGTGDGTDLGSAVPVPGAAPVAGISITGLASTDNITAYGTTWAPPDTNAAVGPTQIVEMTNNLTRVYTKAGGIVTTFKLGDLWPLADPCHRNDGDPIVMYDRLADRWVLTQFSLPSLAVDAPPYFECFAVSTTGDAAGSYYIYTFQTPGAKLPDYPKLGNWTDGYYMSVNNFYGSSAETGAFAFEKAKMLVGDPTASFVFIDTSVTNPGEFLFGVAVSDFDGLLPPPPGRRNVFSYWTSTEYGDFADGLRFFELAPNFANPPASTWTEVGGFTYAAPMPVAAFNPLNPSGRADVPQPSPGQGLDSLGVMMMYRLQYRNFGAYETYAMNHTVNVASAGSTPYRAAIRAYEVRRVGNTFTLFDQMTHSTDSGGGTIGHRWMGSAAIDGSGRLAVMYNRSSSTAGAANNPSIRAIGRDGNTATGAFVAAEELILFPGPGVQTATGNRWGDYSSLQVDPVDDCTFWAAGEIYANTATSFRWLTNINSFRWAGCTNAPMGTAAVNLITNCSGGAPIANATVTFTGGPMSGFSCTTNAAGQCNRLLTPGTYTATITAPNFFPATVNNVVVTNGGTVTVSQCLVGAPNLVAGAGTVTADFCLPLNAAIDPNEQVQVSLCVTNTGAANTVSLVGTLQTTGGVAVAGAPQTYGVVVAGGPAVCRTFDLTAAAVACGSLITASVQFQDGATNLGTLTYDFTAGQVLVTTQLQENFDGVTPPALPAGWVAVNAVGAGQLWVSDPFNPHSAPNSVFVDDPAIVSDKRITSPTFVYNTNMAQLSFWHDFALEGPNYDGGVLEMSTNGGASFVDIVTAGGTFVSNGYNAVISASFSNPIGGRAAWSGSSGGYVNTVVNLPAAGMGLPVQLRWRMGSDSSFAGTSWDLDDVLVTDTLLVCATGPCFTPNDVVVTKVDTPDPVTGGRPLTYTITVFNPGPAPLANVEMRDVLPANTRLAPGSDSLRTPAGWTCTAPYPGTTGTVRCTIPILNPNLAAPSVFGIKTLAPPVCGRTLNLSNTATLTFLGGADPNPANNTATATTLVNGLPCFF